MKDVWVPEERLALQPRQTAGTLLRLTNLSPPACVSHGRKVGPQVWPWEGFSRPRNFMKATQIESFCFTKRFLSKNPVRS